MEDTRKEEGSKEGVSELTLNCVGVDKDDPPSSHDVCHVEEGPHLLAQHPFKRKQSVLTIVCQSAGMQVKQVSVHTELASIAWEQEDEVILEKRTDDASSDGAGSEDKEPEVSCLDEKHNLSHFGVPLNPGPQHGPSSPIKSASSRAQSPNAGFRTEPFAHQAGGARVLRKFSRSLVAKPFCNREAWFYRNGIEKFKKGLSRDSRYLLTLGGAARRQITPEFHGIRRCDRGSPSLLLEDLTHGYRCPCVLDIKMGLSTAAPDRHPDKLHRCKDKDKKTTTGSLGARICGMRVYMVDKGDFEQRDKHWGNTLSPDEFCAGVELFFNNGKRVRRGLVPRFLDRLRKIQAIMEQQTNYHFYASSILFIYEGFEGDEVFNDSPPAAPAGDDGNTVGSVSGGGGGGRNGGSSGSGSGNGGGGSNGGRADSCGEIGGGGGGGGSGGDGNGGAGGGSAGGRMTEEAAAQSRESRLDDEVRVDVRMIDFAHVFEALDDNVAKDASYCSGLRNLMNILDGIANGLSPNEIKVVDYRQEENQAARPVPEAVVFKDLDLTSVDRSEAWLDKSDFGRVPSLPYHTDHPKPTAAHHPKQPTAGSHSGGGGGGGGGGDGGGDVASGAAAAAGGDGGRGGESSSSSSSDDAAPAAEAGPAKDSAAGPPPPQACAAPEARAGPPLIEPPPPASCW